MMNGTTLTNLQKKNGRSFVLVKYRVATLVSRPERLDIWFAAGSVFIMHQYSNDILLIHPAFIDFLNYCLIMRSVLPCQWSRSRLREPLEAHVC